MIIKGYFATVLHNNVCCGYPLESPHRGDSNAHLQHMFYHKISTLSEHTHKKKKQKKKNGTYFWLEYEAWNRLLLNCTHGQKTPRTNKDLREQKQKKCLNIWRSKETDIRGISW